MGRGKDFELPHVTGTEQIWRFGPDVYEILGFHGYVGLDHQDVIRRYGKVCIVWVCTGVHKRVGRTMAAQHVVLGSDLRRISAVSANACAVKSNVPRPQILIKAIDVDEHVIHVDHV